MTATEQVCDFKQAKRLRELRVRQDSLFSWFGDETRRLMDSGKDGISYGGWLYLSTTEPVNGEDADHRQDTETSMPIAAAFTVAELGEMLPDTISGDMVCTYSMSNAFGEGRTLWFVMPFLDVSLERGFETEAKARAALLIFLIEKNKVQVIP